MDWKAAPSAGAFEMAKDVASFANHLGGTLLIGAAERAGQLAAYVGLDPAMAGRVRDSYSKAVADRCQPRPFLDFEEYEVPGDAMKRVVAINVSPSLLLVGVRVAANKQSEGWGGDVYAYPVRSGTDARYLEPSELAMYMTPSIRRTAVLFSRIPSGAEVRVVEEIRDAVKQTETYRFGAVLEDENLVQLKLANGDPFHLPLDRVISVFQTTPNGYWRILVEFHR